MKQVVIRVDASLVIGTGHVMRCLTLANELTNNGAQVKFICRKHNGNLIDTIQKQGFEVISLNNPVNEIGLFDKETKVKEPRLAHANWLGVTQKQDADECQQVLQKIQPDWIIVDHYAIDQAWQKQLNSYYDKLMVIDDLGDRQHICHLLLDQNYGSSKVKYKGLVPESCELLVGSQYAMLRPEFAEWREYSLQRRQTIQLKSLLITMGGVDADNYTGRILKQLEQTQLGSVDEITVIMGANAPHLKEVQEVAKKLTVPTQVKINISNMAEIMANADLAIGAAGSTTWERCCLGLPTIQMVIAENQRQSANALALSGAVKLLDSVEELPGLVTSTIDAIQQVSLKASDVCDGTGVNRLLKEALLQ